MSSGDLPELLYVVVVVVDCCGMVITSLIGDWFALTLEPNVKYELQIVSPPAKGELTKKNSNSNMSTTTTTTTTSSSDKRKRSDDEDSDEAPSKYNKHKHAAKSDSDDTDDSSKKYKSGGQPKKKKVCKYGDQCYRKNKEHLAMYTHSPLHSDGTQFAALWYH